jgi:hypothetical protein
MLTLFGTYILAIAVGAGAAIINDLFFIISLKHHRIKRYEFNILRQLSTIQLVLVLWIILAEVTMFAISVQTLSLQSILGVTIAKLCIEIVILFALLFQRQVYLPELMRHQHAYHHLSDSFLEHSNGLISACSISIVSWFFVVFITSSEYHPKFVDFGFVLTMGIYLCVMFLATGFFLFMKNRILFRKK